MTLQTLYDSAMLRGVRSVPVIGRLGGGTIATVSDSQPFRVVGANAIVYQLRQATGKVVALRCWLDHEISADVVARYRALGEPNTLRWLRGVERAPLVPSLTLHADGITVDAEEFHSTSRPVVVLDWLMGPTVLAAVDRACRSGDASYITALANAWSAAVGAAAEVGFVHGDLAPDNAIVRPKEGIAFVDYDTAYWPDAPSIPELEPSLAYRHPRGLPNRPERADDFAALLIYVSLRITSVWPELRAEHGQPGTVKGAGLLFQPRDLAHPDGSALFGKLRVLNDPHVQGLVSILREACLTDPENMPTFSEALELAANVANSSHLHQAVSPVGRAGSLLASAAAAVRETTGRGTDRLRSTSLAPTPDQSWPERQRNWRPERLAGLAVAIRDADLTRAEELWSDLWDEPGAGALLPALEALRNPAGQEGSSGETSARASRAVERRLVIQRRFANALDHDDRATLADMALSGELDEIDELPEASTRRVIESLAIAHVVRALESDDDNLIIEAYDAPVLGDHRLLTNQQRNRVDLAFDRRGWLDDVRSAISGRDIGAIDRLLAAMPEGGRGQLRDREWIRIERLRGQDAAIRSLRSAIAQGRDADVVSALNTVERSGALIPPDLPWTHVSDVIDRYSVMMAIRRAAEQNPRDIARLGRLLPQLKDSCGGVFPGAVEGLDFGRLDSEVKQAAQLIRIREALATENDRTIVATTLPDLYGVLPLLDRGEQARVERAVAAANRALRRSGHRGNSSDPSSATVETV
jgi:hypothetical protein